MIEHSGTGLNILTFNANGLGDEKKLRKVLKWCKHFKADVLFLQETHCLLKRKSWYTDSWKGDWFHSCGESNARGTSVVISSTLDYTLVAKHLDENGRYMVLDIEHNHKRYLLGNFYGPNVDCTEYLEELLDLLTPLSGQEIIAGGDFNLVMNVLMDKKGGIPRTHEKARKLLLNWCDTVEVVDI